MPRRRSLRYILTGVGAAVLAATLLVAARAASHRQVALVPVEKKSGLSILQPGTYCRNYDTIVYKTELADNLDACQAKCSADDTCNGVLYRPSSNDGCADVPASTCALYTGSCDSQEHMCWERVDVKKQDKFPVTGWGKGCSNWQSIQLGELSYEESEAGCYERCSEYPTCLGFGYQHSEGENGPGIGSCFLWKGYCMKYDNPAWNDHTMVNPTPTIFALTGSKQFCRNHKEILLVEMIERQDGEWACGVQCLLTENCVGFSFKQDESCISDPGYSTSCILYQKECIPEPNSCWSTFGMTSVGQPDLTNLPQIIPNNLPAQVEAELFDPTLTWCKTDLMEHKIDVDPEYDHFDTLIECTNLCYITSGCQGVKYTNDTGCVLLDGLCLDVSGFSQAGDLQLKATGTADKVTTAVTAALGTFGIKDAGVDVAEHRRLAEREVDVGRKLGATAAKTWIIRWTSQEADAKVALAAWDKWQQDNSEFSAELASKLSDAGSTLTAGSLKLKPMSPTGETNPEHVYTLTWPASELATNKRTDVGCSNWKSLLLGPEVTAASKSACASKCEGTLGCTGFGFQKSECSGAGSLAKGTCLLLGGACEEEANACWDAYDMASETNYSLTLPPNTLSTTGAPLHANVGTTITVTTTKLKAGALTVFINEIIDHSDNSDVPGVEIAGPAGTDLTKDWFVVAYNQAGGVVKEKSLKHHGTLQAAHEQVHGVVWQGMDCQKFSAIALVHGSTVKLFLSVLAKVTAKEGKAQGQTSQIIKDEDGNALQILKGETQKSLQVKGRGLSYADFRWRKWTASCGLANNLENFG